MYHITFSNICEVIPQNSLLFSYLHSQTRSNYFTLDMINMQNVLDLTNMKPSKKPNIFPNKLSKTQYVKVLCSCNKQALILSLWDTSKEREK